ncbi:hypothetical protein [Sphingobium sp. BS19]|uniref:hypothetical protein n=1 Tax=Sphingobium sp. BS19 TaxID=3018973 RepID=UPI0022EF90A4|nr:hypothetical protein [Sphingobium sp. BS19]GLI98190.1 hypothetical protein Sbs19_20080 [Sphingobium sp. BS19]
MGKANKTLDEAELDFRHAPGPEGAADLLTVATVYWNDAMIGDETYAEKVRLVRDWLTRPTNSIDQAHEGPIANAARRIASYTDGAARINIYKAAKQELARHGDALRSLLKELAGIFDAIDDLPLNDDGARELRPGMLDRAREISAIAQGQGGAA